VLFNQVNPSDLSNDMDPAFMTEFYMNLRILSQDLYKRHSSNNAYKGPSEPNVSGGSRMPVSQQAKENSHSKISTKAAPDYFNSQNIQDRLKMYAQVGGIPTEYIDRFVADSKNKETNNNSSSNNVTIG
jgi:hypothetical protein